MFFTAFLFALSATGRADEVLERILQREYVEPRSCQIEGFTAHGGTWTVDAGGVLSVDAGSGPKLVCDAPEWQNLTEGEIAVEIFCPGRNNDTNAGILTKVRDAGEGADNFIGYEIAIRPEHDELNVGRHRFNYEPIARRGVPLKTDAWIKLRTRFKERSFEVFIDDKLVFEYEDKEAPLLSGGIALRPWQRAAKFRNLAVKANLDADWTPVPFVETPRVTGKYPDSLAVDKLPSMIILLRHALNRPPAVGQDLMQGQKAPGCEIRLIHPGRPATASRTIFADPGGNIYDMNLSRDAKTIFFAYKKHGEKNYALWKIGVDGTGLEQLTDGSACDVSPCEVPGGDLVFVSTRRFGHTVCQPGPASNLYRLHRSGPDKGKAHCVSMNTLSDMSPQMLPDGRVLFTRWEYIDRDLTYRQSLWTQKPDGTSYQLFFGNTIRDMGTIWQARPLPGRMKQLVATFAPHHNHPHGAIGLVDRSFGVEGPKGTGFRYVTKEIARVADTDFPWGYRDPFPLTTETFLCSYGSDPGLFQDAPNRFKIYLLDINGRKRLLYEDETLSCVFPIPLVPVQDGLTDSLSRIKFYPDEKALETPDDEDAWGVLMLIDVQEGLEGKVKPGTIKSLRVMEQIRKTEDIVHRAYDQSPVMSYGTYYAKRDWGTVPVEADGSAHFYAPALREIYIQALDAEGREVQRMTSALQLMPGENLSCTGCHESRDAAAPVAKRPIAATKAPKKPVSPDWLLNRKRTNERLDARVFDYPTTVQPLLDKHCIGCHEGADPAGGYDLSGDKTRYFNMSYDNLLGRSRSYRQHDMEFGRMLPEEVAKGKPMVHFYWLLWTPSAVSEPYEAGSYASRLTEIIESDHYEVKLSPEERRILYYWMDADVPYYGTYAHSRPGSSGRRDRFADPQSGHHRRWFSDEFKDVYGRRCAECHHRNFEHDADWTGRHAWINLSRPQFSVALTAHQTKHEGGRGIPMGENGPQWSKTDADFKKMLQAIEKGHEDMLRYPEADMPNFPHARPEP